VSARLALDKEFKKIKKNFAECQIGTLGKDFFFKKTLFAECQTKWRSAKNLKKIKKNFAECQIGGTRQRGDLTWPSWPAHTTHTHIVFQMGLACWASTGPVRKSMAQARCGTACLVPVPGPPQRPVVPARARHGFWAGTMRHDYFRSLNFLWMNHNRWIIKPNYLPTPLSTPPLPPTPSCTRSPSDALLRARRSRFFTPSSGFSSRASFTAAALRRGTEAVRLA